MNEPYKTIIIDDDPILTMIFKRLLDKCDIHSSPIDFNNGEQGIEYLLENYHIEPLFIVFLDINMPVMNGWEFMEKLKSFAAPDKVKIYILSSSTNQSDIIKSKSNEFVVDYMVKPLMFETANNLKESISQFVKM